MLKKIIYLVLIFISFIACNKKVDKAPPPSYEIVKEYKRGPVELFIKVDKSEITIADRLNLVIQVKANEEYEVELPEFGEKLQQFGIVNYRSAQPKLGDDNMIIYQKQYELEPFLSGEYKIPSLKVIFYKKGKEDEKRHEVSNEEIAITVKSYLPDDSSPVTIYENAPPVQLPGMDKKVLYLLIGGGLLVAGGLIGMFFYKRGVKKTVITVLLPHETAYDDLEKLVSEDLLKAGEIKLFYLRLSQILRNYIENRFALRAPERTTEEFLAALKYTHVLTGEHKGLLKKFLNHCDLVKFAEHTPSTDEIQTTFDTCKLFISETVIKETKKNKEA